MRRTPAVALAIGILLGLFFGVVLGATWLLFAIRELHTIAPAIRELNDAVLFSIAGLAVAGLAAAVLKVDRRS